MPASFHKFLAPKFPFTTRLCCISLLALLAQVGNAQADELGASPIERQKIVEQKGGAAEIQKLAEQGNALAQYHLGLMYASGNGVLRDEYESAKWFRKAAEQGNVDAQYMLGLVYGTGRGVIRDEKKACDLLRASAEQGHISAIEMYNKVCAKGRRDNL